MSKDNKPEDLENTIRLDTKQIMDPYANPAPTIESIEDVFNADHDVANTPYHLPEEAIVPSEENIDLSDLNKEVNELSNEFEFNILEEPKNEVQKIVPEDFPMDNKPVEKEIPETNNDTTSQEEIVTEEAPESHKKSTAEKPDLLPTDDKKEITKTAAPASETKEHSTNSNKPSGGINIAMLFISLIALASGFTGAWVSMSLQAQVDSLYTELSAVHNNHSNYLQELTENQKKLAILKQELATLQLKQVTSPSDIKQKTAIIVPVKKALPAAITPTTPIKEIIKPASHKNTWNVIISSHNLLKKAKLEQQNKIISAIQTNIVPAVVKGRNWYRIVATGFADKQQAVSFTHKLKKQGITDAWVQYNK